MLQIASVTPFTLSELLRGNQQGGVKLPQPSHPHRSRLRKRLKVKKNTINVPLL